MVSSKDLDLDKITNSNNMKLKKTEKIIIIEHLVTKVFLVL